MKKDKEEINCKTFCKKELVYVSVFLFLMFPSRFHHIIFEEIPVLLPRLLQFEFSQALVFLVEYNYPTRHLHIPVLDG